MRYRQSICPTRRKYRPLGRALRSVISIKSSLSFGPFPSLLASLPRAFITRGSPSGIKHTASAIILPAWVPQQRLLSFCITWLSCPSAHCATINTFQHALSEGRGMCASRYLQNSRTSPLPKQPTSCFLFTAACV